jgi:response regulator of citrate/malate metabolism
MLKSKIEKKVLIYIVSSSNNPDDLIQAKSINEITDYLVKPLNRDEYTSILNSFLILQKKRSGFIKAKLP